ncbi:MAG: hypothetical protein OEZ14_08115 [Acidimicrobiia bacterium]|nr:hypothetical protein [Acidimicrobiia bacterium]MDH5520482.1 hypothetical protein [Acidimicrobiia bacterium]
MTEALAVLPPGHVGRVLEPSGYRNARAFTGASLPASMLVGVADPVAAAKGS